VTDSGYYRMIAEARRRLEEGEDLQAVLALLRSHLTYMECIGAVRTVLGVDLTEAKRTVLDSPVFAEERARYDAAVESFIEAENE
jgi:ribosomal protein L7/L12